MRSYLLAYLFLCFSVGIACLSVIVIAARRRNPLARAVLPLYLLTSLLVMVALLRTFLDLAGEPLTPAVRFAIEYLESIVGMYGLMFFLPYFAHRLFGVSEVRRDRVIAAIVIATALIQHLTEYVLGGVWDDRGDVFENLVFAGLVAYTLWIGFAHLGGAGTHRPLAARFLALLALGLPGLVYDLFLSDETALRFYPLWYCAASLIIAHGLMQRPPAARRGTLPPEWGLSERESEVARLVLLGCSNKDIAAQLHISPNTVKTHLRAVFDKSGMHSRFELISVSLRESPPESGHGPEEPA